MSGWLLCASVSSCGAIVRRAADRHRGLQDPSRRSAGSALPGALHPPASAHHGLPEGTVTGIPNSWSLVLTCLLFPGRPAAYVVRTFPHQVQQLSLSGGMMHPWDSRTSVGRTADLLALRRGKERGRAHSEAVSSSLVHAFPPVKTLRKDTGVWIPRPLISTSSSLSHVLPLLPPPPPLSPFFLFHSPVVELISSPSVRSRLTVFSFFFLASLSFLPQMNWRASPPPLPPWTWGCETRLWFIYIFLASSWSL